MNKQYSAITKEEKDLIVQALVEFKRIHIWKNDLEKKRKWIAFLREISKIVDIKRPKLVINKKISEFGYYKPLSNRIVISKYSVITLLHEFYHAVHTIKNINSPHEEAWRFSNEVFFKVFPKKKSKLKFQNGAYIKRTEEQ